jgi:hypothetical protein
MSPSGSSNPTAGTSTCGQPLLPARLAQQVRRLEQRGRGVVLRGQQRQVVRLSTHARIPTQPRPTPRIEAARSSVRWLAGAQVAKHAVEDLHECGEFGGGCVAQQLRGALAAVPAPYGNKAVPLSAMETTMALRSVRCGLRTTKPADRSASTTPVTVRGVHLKTWLSSRCVRGPSLCSSQISSARAGVSPRLASLRSNHGEIVEPGLWRHLVTRAGRPVTASAVGSATGGWEQCSSSAA